LETHVQGIIKRRRERLGPGKLFEGYESSEALTIIMFMIGVGRAVNTAAKDLEKLHMLTTDELKNGLDKWWNNVFDEETKKEFEEGFNKMRQGLDDL
jgi:hypothetical protein